MTPSHQKTLPFSSPKSSMNESGGEQRQNILETPHYGSPVITPIVSKLISEVNAKSSIMMIDERLDEQLVEQFR